MYTTYITDAIVCAHEQAGETDVRLELFTRDFGMVWARAAGLRAEQSKLRYSLQVGAHVRITLVSGNHGWRVTGADVRASFIGEGMRNISRAVRILRLVRILLAIEEPHADLFHALVAVLPSIHEDADEIACAAYVLGTLGFLDVSHYVTYEEWRAYSGSDYARVLERVNTALQSNHIGTRSFSPMFA